ncbi:MAG: hypothetical protein L6Q37_14475, partial [Bdellovibrionaceae bacterium]|nr:hypothetical protein [Pseudobdellovibrionaceae bacterium]
MKKLSHLNKTLAIISLFILTISCTKNKQNDENITGTSTSASEVLGVSQYNINSFPLNKLVCDPFSTDPVPSPKHGIKASLWYRGLGQLRYYTVMDYLLHTTHSEQNLFLVLLMFLLDYFPPDFPLKL